jgi:hypothetical protein
MLDQRGRTAFGILVPADAAVIEGATGKNILVFVAIDVDGYDAVGAVGIVDVEPDGFHKLERQQQLSRDSCPRYFIGFQEG